MIPDGAGGGDLIMVILFAILAYVVVFDSEDPDYSWSDENVRIAAENRLAEVARIMGAKRRLAEKNAAMYDRAVESHSKDVDLHDTM